MSDYTLTIAGKEVTLKSNESRIFFHCLLTIDNPISLSVINAVNQAGVGEAYVKSLLAKGKNPDDVITYTYRYNVKHEGKIYPAEKTGTATRQVIVNRAMLALSHNAYDVTISTSDEKPDVEKKTAKGLPALADDV